MVLQKHYELETGEILINDKISLEEIKLKNWRNKVGVVPQEITIFNGTVLDNIVFGIEQNPKTIIDFCKELGFNEIFESFPQGYSTMLGEEGANISGGQKQILALARTIYKNPEFLILDEATSALDQKTEMKVLKLLSKLKKKMSILFITHRMHVLKHIADNIYILDKKKILADGTHEELLQGDNPYTDFWKGLK
jgi:ATP-binding cassette subfamily B protein